LQYTYQAITPLFFMQHTVLYKYIGYWNIIPISYCLIFIANDNLVRVLIQSIPIKELNKGDRIVTFIKLNEYG
jgi:hypothetical protein